MKNVRWATAALTVIVAAGLLVAAASARVSSPTKQAASIQACALLPDTTTSTRYTLFDAPYLKAAFKKANIAASVLNAHADPQKQKSQAQQCLAQGACCITAGAPEDGAPAVKRSYLQYFLYGPMQTWLFFRKPSLKRSV